jgi:hypothetical protein
VANASALRSPFRGWENAASRGFIVVVAVVLAWYTWATWGDIQIDCGREIYVPLEILRGKLLYRDIFYPYGPLAPYAGALLIAIFGPHLVAFYLFGIAVAVGCAFLLFELGTMLESRAVGLTAALALLFMGFAPSIFNYVFPYSYGATMGLLLSLLCAFFTTRHLLSRPGYNLLLAGLAASLALLSKQEFGAACYIMLAFVIVMGVILQRSLRPLFNGIASFALGVTLWVAIYGYFFWTLTPSYMVNANWIGMPGTFSMRTGGAHLYAIAGQRFLPREMVALAVFAGLCLVPWFLLAKAHQTVRNVALAILVGIAVTCRFGQLDLLTRIATALLVFPIGMFFVGCGFVTYSTYQLLKTGDRRHLAEGALGILALIPAVRVFAAIEPFGYSVYCAIPLFLVFLIVISRCIKGATPDLSAEQQEGLVRYLMAAEIMMLALICIPQANERPAALATSWGAIHLEPEEARVAQQILAFMSEQDRRGQQVAALPEAPMLYALTGTQAPSRWFTLLPGLLSPSQEDTYIADLNTARPEYILLTGRKTAEYGAAYFGIDYDQKIYHWIEANYHVAGQFGRFRRDGSGSRLAAMLYEKERSGHDDQTR